MLLGYLETPSTPINHGQVSYCKPRWDAFGTGAVIRYCTHIGHWPDPHVFITRTIELWNRWIRRSCYYNRV